MYVRGSLSKPQTKFPPNYVRPSHYVNEMSTKYGLIEFEQSVRQKLTKFVNSYEQECIIDRDLDDRRNYELVHSIACELDLRTQSSENQIRVTKPYNTRSVILMNAQRISLDKQQNNLIADHLQEYPIDLVAADKHLRTDLDACDERRSVGSFNNLVPLVPPKAQTSNEMDNFRQRLPAYQKKREILDAIDTNRVTIITGGTGCGKTTQVPQFLLEQAAAGRHEVRIFCTQPRRLPAIAVADRVARERGEQVGDTVGYHIRLEQKSSENTVLTYCTAGVLLRMLSMDPLATGITHIILDEVHEREQNTDYLLIILREALKERRDLKIILMSATIEGNREMFENYFSRFRPCGQCNIPSRLYSVQKLYLPEILALTGYMPHSNFVTWGNAGYKDSNNFPQVDGFNESQQYDHLPTVRTVPDLQSYDNQPQGQQPHAQNSWQQQQSHYGPPSNQYHPQHSEELTRSSTVPSNLQYAMQPNYYSNYYYNNPNVYVTSAYGQSNQQQQQPYMMYENNWNMQSNYYPSNQQYSQSYQQGSSSQSTNQLNSGYQRSGYGQKNSEPSTKTLLNEWFPDRPAVFDPSYIQKLRQVPFDDKLLLTTYQNNGGQQWEDSIDPSLTAEVIKYCMDSTVQGSILCFLPGYDDIINLRDKVYDMRSRCKPAVYTLHSQMNSQDQQQVFEEAKPGYRKVILSTNIAEASLTIDDVVFVIDCGKVKEKIYEHDSRISQLKVSWIAKSNAEQRAGRAGRCQNGYCFRLYSEQNHKDMLLTQVAEMRRSAIHELVLHAKMFAPNGMSVRRFLDCAPEPPSSQAIDRSLEFLEQLGALFNEKKSLQPASYLTEQYQNNIPQHIEPKLTNLGKILSHLPIEPQLSRLLLYGVALSVLQPIITLVAALAHREPFTLPNGNEKDAALNARDRFSKLDYSDHLLLLRVFNAYSDLHPSQIQQFCRQNFFSKPALTMISGIRRQLFMELKRLHILPQNARDCDDPEYNQFSTSWPMIQGVLVAGSYPGIAFIRSGSKLRKIHTIVLPNSLASLHPSSTLRRQVQTNKHTEYLQKCYNSDEPNIECLIYQELSKIDEGLTLRTVSAVTPLAAMMFSGPIKMQKYIFDDYELLEEDYDAHLFPKNVEINEDEVQAPDFESNDLIPLRYQRDFYVECDQELVFKGPFRELQHILKLRFKLNSYFLDFLEHPLRAFSQSDFELLRCVAKVLEMEHKNCKFNEVTDTLPKRQIPRNQPRFQNQQRSSTQFNQPQRRPPSPQQSNEYTQQIPANNYTESDSPPADPTPTVAPPVFDTVQAKPVQPAKQQRSNYQEPSRSSMLLKELDRAQGKGGMQKRSQEPVQRSEPSSNSNRNENSSSRRTQTSEGFYGQQDYDQQKRSDTYTHNNSYDKSNDRSFQQDRDYGNQSSGRFTGYNNARPARGVKNDLYVPPARRNTNEDRRDRQSNEYQKRGNFRSDVNYRMEDLKMDDDNRAEPQRNNWNDDRRQDGGRKRNDHHSQQSFRGNRTSGGGSRVYYGNQAYKKRGSS